MEKQKPWQLAVIVAVILLTLYNILPTIFYYSKPLKSPIDEQRAEQVSQQIVSRVNALEQESKNWLQNYTTHLGITPESISFSPKDPSIYEIKFKDSHDANLFKQFLPRAGALIPFVPAQLELDPVTARDTSDKVVVLRQIRVHLDPSDAKKLFHFVPREADGKISKGYRTLVNDRAAQLALAFGGTSKYAEQIKAIAEHPNDPQYDTLALSLARDIQEIENTFGSSDPIAQRMYSSFTQVESENREKLIQNYLARIDQAKGRAEQALAPLAEKQSKAEGEGEFLDSESEQKVESLTNQIATLDAAKKIIEKNRSAFQSSKGPLSLKEIRQELARSEEKMTAKEPIQTVSLKGRNPLVDALVVDWGNNRIELHLYKGVEKMREGRTSSEEGAYQKDKLNQFLINDIARASRMTDENISPEGDGYAVALSSLTNPQSFLTMNLGYIAAKQSKQLEDRLISDWNPKHADLLRDVYPVRDYANYKKLPLVEQRLGLVVYAPSMHTETPPKGFKTDSIYVIARGLQNIVQKYESSPDDPSAVQLNADFGKLNRFLQKYGFIGYPGSSYGVAEEFRNDYIFELDDFYSMLITATREDFVAKGSKRFAVLPFTDVEQRIITLNRIDDQMHEELLQWKDEYNSAQVDLDVTHKYEVPPPTENAIWENIKLSMVKYFRGDDQNILKWGLDLSGGKTVRIGLRDSNNQVVTDPEDLKQAVNELYTRINKMGVSERAIRIENNNIILDFPGSQALSAQELIKASAMYFHIVNEKFTPHNTNLREHVNTFLQEIWNEAVVTNRKDSESINEIAWMHLGGDTPGIRARSEAAKVLYENGLRIENPKEAKVGNTFNDTLSKIAVMRGDDFSEWQGQSYPLVVVFQNYALEGSNLTNVQAGYDPSEGNILSFSVKSSYDRASGSPREDFYNWTSQFAEDRISGSAKEAYSQGRGWRMAVILNDTIVTMPNLRAALRDQGMISGRFSQREISQLAADLKAGSLSFTPRILSEQNVSPELGKEERSRGIRAALVGLGLVAFAMIGYYSFAGLVATCAVMLNLLIMWGVLQNLDAALTLPGIAGIVLTIGMAVDANVLVFERIREEFAISGRISSAIQAGYNKAFSAILDSNITTIMAALILIQFDSGPIKGFAVTLIIGLVSSMFTALFMTRYFFAGWVRNPKNTELKMYNWFGETKIDFLKWAKPVLACSLIVMVVGSFLFYEQRNSIFGMDFTGGYSLMVELEEQPGENDYRQEATNALAAQGATPVDFQIQQLSKPNHLRIQLGMGMEEPGKPFYGMPESLPEENNTYEYQSNPRISWVVDALNTGGLQIQQSDLDTLNKDWTMMSGQFSQAMRDNALFALTLALASILIYITIRFEFKFAVGAVLALAHDVVVSLGILAMFRYAGFPVQIDLEVVGAIMTIIGYSLNNTIIIFDRIREDTAVYRKLPFHDIINHAVNVTLSRTLLTSGTTLLVLVSLVVLGGQAIFDFSLVMTIGVAVGTVSSLFLAAPMMLFFHNRELQKVSA